MAERANLQSHSERDRMERVELPTGYRLGADQRVQDVLAVEAELLRSEGVDPAWPGYAEAPRGKR